MPYSTAKVKEEKGGSVQAIQGTQVIGEEDERKEREEKEKKEEEMEEKRRKKERVEEKRKIREKCAWYSLHDLVCLVCSDDCRDSFRTCSRCRGHLHAHCLPEPFSPTDNPELYWSSIVSDSILCPDCSMEIRVKGERGEGGEKYERGPVATHLGPGTDSVWSILEKVSSIQRHRLSSLVAHEKETMMQTVWCDGREGGGGGERKRREDREAWEGMILLIRWASLRFVLLKCKGLHDPTKRGVENSCELITSLMHDDHARFFAARATRFACKMNALSSLKESGHIMSQATDTLKGNRGGERESGDEEGGIVHKTVLRIYETLSEYFESIRLSVARREEKGELGAGEVLFRDLGGVGRLATMAAAYVYVTSEFTSTQPKDQMLEIITLFPFLRDLSIFQGHALDVAEERVGEREGVEGVESALSSVLQMRDGTQASMSTIISFLDNLLASFMCPPVTVKNLVLPTLFSGGAETKLIYPWIPGNCNPSAFPFPFSPIYFSLLLFTIFPL